MSTDPISDMLTIIRNGYLARKKEVLVPHSSFSENLAKILARGGYLREINKKENKLILTLIYENRTPKLTGLKKISKPGLRVYVNKNHLPSVLGGLGAAIISTPQGLMTDKEARKKGLGGEVICKVW